MGMATRNGSAEWRGDLQGGSGELTVGDGVFQGQYSFKSRFEEGDGTNPEELIAAAHASCYAMALSGDDDRAASTTSPPRDTCATTSTSGSSPRSAASAPRTIAWSSASRTRITAR